MSDRKRELDRLLSRYRGGEISEHDLLAEVEHLDRRAGHLAGVESVAGAELVATLDAYRAAEASGAQTLEAWIQLTDDDGLIGGLRSAAAREARHASLLEDRLQELGGRPAAVIPEWLRAYNAVITDPAATDLERLAAIVEKFPDIGTAIAPVRALIESIDGDALTRELLRAICVDELATVRWAHEAYSDRSD